MLKVQTVAMILAGGKGSRLGVLSKNNAKPGVPFGGGYRIIDFTISNCVNSDIEHIGVLTQYKPRILNSHIGVGKAWDLDRYYAGISILPPYMTENEGKWYIGTADAVTQNLDFIDKYAPEYVLVLSGDHIYKMDYSKMIEFHKRKGSQLTIAVQQVPIEEASRFGVMNADEQYKIYEFEEKPKEPKSDLISMGIYVFNYRLLKKYLLEDAENEASAHDFGKNIIPKMLADNQDIYAYPFKGYWKDVGTISSYLEANMDLLNPDNPLKMHDEMWKIYSTAIPTHATYYGKSSHVSNSLIADGAMVYGTVKNSIISTAALIEEGAVIENSIIMDNCHIQKNASIQKSIVCSGVKIGENAKIGVGDNKKNILQPHIYNNEITVIGVDTSIGNDIRIGKNVMIDTKIALNNGIKEIDSGECIFKGVRYNV